MNRYTQINDLYSSRSVSPKIFPKKTQSRSKNQVNQSRQRSLLDQKQATQQNLKIQFLMMVEQMRNGFVQCLEWIQEPSKLDYKKLDEILGEVNSFSFSNFIKTEQQETLNTLCSIGIPSVKISEEGYFYSDLKGKNQSKSLLQKPQQSMSTDFSFKSQTNSNLISQLMNPRVSIILDDQKQANGQQTNYSQISLINKDLHLNNTGHTSIKLDHGVQTQNTINSYVITDPESYLLTEGSKLKTLKTLPDDVKETGFTFNGQQDSIDIVQNTLENEFVTQQMGSCPLENQGTNFDCASHLKQPISLRIPSTKNAKQIQKITQTVKLDFQNTKINNETNITSGSTVSSQLISSLPISQKDKMINKENYYRNGNSYLKHIQMVQSDKKLSDFKYSNHKDPMAILQTKMSPNFNNEKINQDYQDISLSIGGEIDEEEKFQNLDLYLKTQFSMGEFSSSERLKKNKSDNMIRSPCYEQNIIKSLGQFDYKSGSIYLQESSGKENDIKFLISAQWWRKWCDYVEFQSSSTETSGNYENPGRIVNQDLISQIYILRENSIQKSMLNFVPLKENILLHHDYQAVNQDIFNQLQQWYGCDYLLLRFLKRDYKSGELYLELYPDIKATQSAFSSGMTSRRSSNEYRFNQNNQIDTLVKNDPFKKEVGTELDDKNCNIF